MKREKKERSILSSSLPFIIDAKGVAISSVGPPEAVPHQLHSMKGGTDLCSVEGSLSSGSYLVPLLSLYNKELTNKRSSDAFVGAFIDTFYCTSENNQTALKYIVRVYDFLLKVFFFDLFLSVTQAKKKAYPELSTFAGEFQMKALKNNSKLLSYRKKKQFYSVQVLLFLFKKKKV